MKPRSTWFGTLVLAATLLASPAVTVAGWRTLEPGLDLGEFKRTGPTIAGDSTVVILRVDPALWDLRLVCAGADSTAGPGGHAGAVAGGVDGGVAGGNAGRTRGGDAGGVADNLTAEGWCKREGLTAAINAGMFATNYRTHVGYLRAGKYVNCPSSNQYQSVAAFGPRREGLPRFRIHDLDRPGVSMPAINNDYDCVVQNLRLIQRSGVNRWSPQENRWSEAALGEDSQGRALFIFSRSPFSMHDFNDILTGLPIDIVCAQHLEGGPEAQLYVHTAAFELKLFGSYETAFNANDRNPSAWPIPNVIGIVRRAVPGDR